MNTIEEFYAAAAERFTPGGPGRIDWYMTDSEVVEMLKVTTRGYEETGALFVVATPAGIVAIKPRPRAEYAGKVAISLEDELRAGRHDCGYSREGRWRTPTRGARRSGVDFAGDAIVRAGR